MPDGSFVRHSRTYNSRMDDLDQREAFLKAIFAAPDDDLPRLVFADWLDERGDAEWAERIRRECHGKTAGRGFMADGRIEVSVPLLSDPDSFRRVAVVEHPEWYGTGHLTVNDGLIASSKPINTILNSPVTQHVTRLDLSGTLRIEVVEAELETAPQEWSPLAEFTYSPTVTLQAVEALVNARECRRFTHLDLRNNDLDNDAARVILRSTNLTRLQSLHLFDGNRLRGRTWAQLIDRFGEEVVS